MTIIIQYIVFPALIALLLSVVDYSLKDSETSYLTGKSSKASSWIWSLSIFILIGMHMILLSSGLGKENFIGFISSFFVLLFTGILSKKIVIRIFKGTDL